MSENQNFSRKTKTGVEQKRSEYANKYFFYFK